MLFSSIGVLGWPSDSRSSNRRRSLPTDVGYKGLEGTPGWKRLEGGWKVVGRWSVGQLEVMRF